MKFFIPTAISCHALFIAIRDRRPRLILRQRKGDWCELARTQTESDVIFRGIVEVYNASSRANVIRGYAFWGKREGADWEAMESEVYQESPTGQAVTKSNVTPLTLAPYSGVEVNVLAFTKMPFVMQVRIEVEDLFGRGYRLEVRPKSQNPPTHDRPLNSSAASRQH
jgi:hypothetical protein